MIYADGWIREKEKRVMLVCVTAFWVKNPGRKRSLLIHNAKGRDRYFIVALNNKLNITLTLLGDYNHSASMLAAPDQ